jgi:uncharacterized membrane protein YgaE (UPF0421/DUF939 family)
MEKVCKLVFCMLLFLLGVGTGAVVNAQLTPPPPALSYSEQASFTNADREKLDQIHKMVRSVRARIFRLEEEDNILKLH